MNEILFLRFFTALATTNADDPDIHAANDYAISLVKSNRAALARAEAAEAEALKQARCAAQARMRHANLLRRRGLEEPLTTVENEAEAAGLRARAEATEAERDDLRERHDNLKTAYANLVQEAADRLTRMCSAEAEAARLRDAGRLVQEEVTAWRDSYRDLDEQRLALTARVAELEAQLAAQGWRPVTEKPTASGRYLVWCPAPWPGYEIAPYDRGWGYIDLRFTHWQPLPPAPDTQEPTL